MSNLFFMKRKKTRNISKIQYRILFDKKFYLLARGNFCIITCSDIICIIIFNRTL